MPAHLFATIAIDDYSEPQVVVAQDNRPVATITTSEPKSTVARVYEVRKVGEDLVLVRLS